MPSAEYLPASCRAEKSPQRGETGDGAAGGGGNKIRKHRSGSWENDHAVA
ncbi:hypothetical protein [[Phormidium] sp. ETS-05]|nr:hypothetical protein [[Phormidium] sp. ETS-05]